MFSLSQLVLRYSSFCKESSISSYSIAIGVMLYASIYLYLLFYYHDILPVFNKFIIYIISVDLLVSIFLHMNNSNSTSNSSYKNDSDSLETNNKIENQLSDSDDSLTSESESDIAESDIEVHSCDDLELDFSQQLNQLEQNPQYQEYQENQQNQENQEELQDQDTQEVQNQDTQEQVIDLNINNEVSKELDYIYDNDSELEKPKKRGRKPKSQLIKF